MLFSAINQLPLYPRVALSVLLGAAILWVIKVAFHERRIRVFNQARAAEGMEPLVTTGTEMMKMYLTCVVYAIVLRTMFFLYESWSPYRVGGCTARFVCD